jgi:hypothetical protein
MVDGPSADAGTSSALNGACSAALESALALLEQLVEPERSVCPEDVMGAIRRTLAFCLQAESVMIAHGEGATSVATWGRVAEACAKESWTEPEIAPYSRTVHPFVVVIRKTNAVSLPEFVPEGTAIVVGRVDAVEFEMRSQEPSVVHVRVSYAKGPVEMCKSALMRAVLALQWSWFPKDEALGAGDLERVPSEGTPHFAVDVEHGERGEVCEGMEALARRFYLRSLQQRKRVAGSSPSQSTATTNTPTTTP